MLYKSHIDRRYEVWAESTVRYREGEGTPAMPTSSESQCDFRLEPREMRSRRLIENSSGRRKDKLMSVGKINLGVKEIVTISSSSSDDEANTISVNHQTNGKKGKAPKVETKKKTVAKVEIKKKKEEEEEKENESGANQKKRKNKGEESMVAHKKKKLQKEALGQGKNGKGKGESVAPKKKEEGQEESKVTQKKKRKKEEEEEEEEEEESVALQKGKGQEENKGSPKKKKRKEEENREGVENQKKKGKGEEESSKGNLKKKKKKGERTESAVTLKENRKKAVEKVTPVHLEINDKKNQKKKQKKENKGNEEQKVAYLTSNQKDEGTKKKGKAHCGYNFPMRRIEKIVRSELDDARISQEALFLINNASEKFLQQFVDDAYASSIKDHKNYVSYKHLASAVSKIKRFDFLSDFVPERVSAEKALAERSAKT